MKRPVKVLFVSGGRLDYGGISTVMLNFAGQMDTSKVQIDFLVHGFDKGPREAESEALGARVIHVPHKAQDYFGNRKAILNAYEQGGYDVVHAHMDGMNGYVLGLAKRAGIQNRISHCHNTQFLTTNPIRVALHRGMANRIERVATVLAACSEKAGRFLYGDRVVDGGRLVIIKNAIALERYRFDMTVRARMRASLGLDGRFVIGHIGRFDYQKNQEFLLPLLAEVIKTRPDACLVLVGDGQARQMLTKQIDAFGLREHVMLAGFCEDVPAMLAAFDLFVLPSRFEGLGIVLIEAQASGLPCIASDAVPLDTRVTDCRYLSLDDTEAWRQAVAAAEPNTDEVRVAVPRAPFVAAGYDILTEGRKLEQLYLELTL